MNFLEFYFAYACGFFVRPYIWKFVAWVRGNKYIDTIMYPAKNENCLQDEGGAQ